MEQPLYINDKKPDNKAMDYDYLRAEGIRLVQSLTGAFWTDYNEHDPGVTILEQLCFAITDLAYRTDFDIQDHLYNDANDDSSFFGPDQILPCNALTINDYRKLLFDSVFEIKNVWLIPTDNDTNSINGLYKILLDVDENIKDKKERQKILNKAKLVYLNNRNICEDIEQIKILDHLPVSIHADVEVDGSISPEKVLAKILYLVDEYLCPEMRFYSLEELLESGYDLKDIFNGPLLKHGFVKTEELPPKPDKILISEIMKIIMQVEGVSSVKNLKLLVGDQEYENQIDISEYQLPKLIIDDSQKTINFFKGVVNYSLVDQKIVKRVLNEMKSANRRVYRLSEEHIEIPQGNKIEVENYYSIQNQFPINYGIGEEGVPHSPSIKRQAQALQLKGYLMLFEQILANYLSQLANSKKLLAIKSDIKQTYFYQQLDNIPNVKALYKEKPGGLTDGEILSPNSYATSYQEGLPQLIDESDDFNDRRNRLLDYLLAIHGEEFSQTAMMQFNYYFTDDEYQKYLVDNKTRFLEFLPFINKNRARGFNYMDTPDTPGNISGLEVKLSVLMGLRAYSLKESGDNKMYVKNSFLEHFTSSGLTLTKDKKTRKTKKGKEVTKKESKQAVSQELIDKFFDYVDEDEITMSKYSQSYTDELLKKVNIFSDKRLSEGFLREGLEIENFQVGHPDGEKEAYLVFKSPSQEEWLEMGRYTTTEDAAVAGIALTQFLRDMNLKSEGLHFVEHNLLRPPVTDRKFGLYLLDEYGNRILSSAKQYTYEERLKIMGELKPHLASYDNYSVEITSTKDFEIHFKTPDGKIKMVSVIARASVEETHAQLEQLFAYLSDGDVITPYEKKVGFYIRNTKDGPLVPEDFYTYRATILFPAWTARFNNKEFRSIAEEIVFVNQSASMASVLHWLEIDVMGEFESKYYAWLEAKRIEDTPKEKLDEATDELTRFLIQL